MNNFFTNTTFSPLSVPVGSGGGAAQSTSYDTFPLYSSKYLAYKDWCRVQDLCKGKTLTKEDVVEIESIKAQFNSKRKLFDFSHLDSLTL